jgi:hypothetical protein
MFWHLILFLYRIWWQLISNKKNQCERIKKAWKIVTFTTCNPHHIISYKLNIRQMMRKEMTIFHSYDGNCEIVKVVNLLFSFILLLCCDCISSLKLQLNSIKFQNLFDVWLGSTFKCCSHLNSTIIQQHSNIPWEDSCWVENRRLSEEANSKHQNGSLWMHHLHRVVYLLVQFLYSFSYSLVVKW